MTLRDDVSPTAEHPDGVPSGDRTPHPGPPPHGGRETITPSPRAGEGRGGGWSDAKGDDVRALSPRRPRFVDLDPSRRLAPTEARLDRLIRAILAHPRAFDPKGWRKVAARVARRHDPLAPRRLIDEAIDRLVPWLDGPVGRELAGAASVERSVSWTLAWPPEGPDATVFRGAIDLACRDREGVARVVVVGPPAAPGPRERLRLLLSARAADALGLGPVRTACRIRLGHGGGLHGEELFDAIAIDEAVQVLLRRGTILRRRRWYGGIKNLEFQI